MPFQPMPYVPSANRPTASKPHAPHMPCTEIAPHGSSTRAFLSKNSTLQHTSAPAMIPMTTEAQGATNAHGAVMATRPASIPLHVIEMSGLPHFQLVQHIAITAPADADSSVFTATMPMRRSVAPKVEPGLKPIHPKVRTSVPITTYPKLCPGKARTEPSFRYFPMRGPSNIASANAAHPPVACTTPDPAKSTAPWPRCSDCPRWASQPPPHTQLP
jgi:hypothetical protein